MNAYLLKTPPSNEALRHSGGESLRCTSATVTLYLDVEDRREHLPGTEQKTSVGVAPIPVIMMSFVSGFLPPVISQSISICIGC